MSSLDPYRRQILKSLAASACAAALPGTSFSQGAGALYPFALGVASGSPGADSVVLWTRLMHVPDPRSGVLVRWEIAHDEGFSRLVQRGEISALPELAHSAHAEVTGLEPDRQYFYRFLTGSAASPVGRTRTLPAADAEVRSLRLAYASCQRWDHGHYSAWRHMRADDPDLVLFLGDYIYEYPRAANAVRAPTGGWVLTLQDYRERHALHKSDPAMQAMHASCPWIVTWDDHEVQNDYAGLSHGDSGPPVHDFAARRAAAYQAYYEHMPLPQSVLTRALQGLSRGAEMRLYGASRYGRLATIHLTDARQYRDPHADCPRPPGGRDSNFDPTTCTAVHDPKRSFLGQAQERWLDQSFAQGSGGWNILAQQTLLGRRDFLGGPGQLLWKDGWDGYPEARSRLTDSMRRHALANPVVLGGDVHENWVGHVLPDYEDAKAAPVGVEFCGTSITSRSFGNSRMREWLAENPHFVFADSERKGYGLAEFNARRLQVRLRVVDDVARPDSGVGTLAQFEVQAGRARVERA